MPSNLGDNATAKEEYQGSKSQSLVTKLQIAVAIMVPFFGVINACQSQYLQAQLQQVRQESERKQQFAGSIQAQLDNLTGQDATKAKVALASLYTLAKEESDKTILFTIAMVSGSKALRDTIADLVLEDTAASLTYKEQLRLKLGKIVSEASQDNGLAADPEAGSKKDVSAEKRLLEQLSNEEDVLKGWIYLGKAKKGSNLLLEDKTAGIEKIPAGVNDINLTTSVNLRESAPSPRSLGRIIGIVSKGSKVTVEEVKKKQIDKVSDAVWARVTVRDES